MKRYLPSNKVSSNGVTLLLLASVIGGVAIGGITTVISRFLYLVILFPFLMGAAGGIGVAGAIEKGKVRNPFMGVAFGALTGIIIYGSYNYGKYLVFKQDNSSEIAKELGRTLPEETTNQIIDKILVDKTGSAGFWGYTKYRAKQGIKIGHVGSDSNSKIPLDENSTWFYWLTELALIEVCAINMAYSAAKKPFCESCQQWYKDKQHIGSVNVSLSDNFLNLVNNYNLTEAGKLVVRQQQISPPSLEIFLQRCVDCPNNDFVLTASKASLNSKGELKLKEHLQGMISSTQQAELLRTIQNSGETN